MAFGNDINIKRVLEKLNDTLDNIKDITHEMDEVALNNYNDDSEQLKTYIQVCSSNIKSELFSWINYTNSYRDAINTSEIEYEDRIKALNMKVNQLTGMIKTYKHQELQLLELINTLNGAINVINDNSQLISNSVGMRNKLKQRMTGELHPRYISEIDNDILIEDYTGNGYKITDEMKEYYEEHFGITYHGLRERLIRLGAWVGRNK